MIHSTFPVACQLSIPIFMFHSMHYWHFTLKEAHRHRYSMFREAENSSDRYHSNSSESSIPWRWLGRAPEKKHRWIIIEQVVAALFLQCHHGMIQAICSASPLSVYPRLPSHEESGSVKIIETTTLGSLPCVLLEFILNLAEHLRRRITTMYYDTQRGTRDAWPPRCYKGRTLERTKNRQAMLLLIQELYWKGKSGQYALIS